MWRGARTNTDTLQEREIGGKPANHAWRHAVRGFRGCGADLFERIQQVAQSQLSVQIKKCWRGNCPKYIVGDSRIPMRLEFLP